MRKIRLANHLTDEELVERMNMSEDKKQFRRWQAIYLIQTQGLSSEQVAEIVRVASGTVLQWVSWYNHNGEDGLTFRGSGGRRNFHMSYEEEVAFLRVLEKEAAKGLMVTAKVIRQRAEEKLGYEVSEDYAYDLLHRHHWKKATHTPGTDKENVPVWLKKHRKNPTRTINGRLKSSSKINLKNQVIDKEL